MNKYALRLQEAVSKHTELTKVIVLLIALFTPIIMFYTSTLWYPGIGLLGLTINPVHVLLALGPMFIIPEIRSTRQAWRTVTFCLTLIWLLSSLTQIIVLGSAISLWAPMLLITLVCSVCYLNFCCTYVEGDY